MASDPARASGEAINAPSTRTTPDTTITPPSTASFTSGSSTSAKEYEPAPAAQPAPVAFGKSVDQPAPDSSRQTLRIEWLDGVRAIAATFVVLHHVWLMTYGGYPDNNGPWFLGPLVYGHLAVVVFIVVSGFSLTLSPSGNSYRLKEGARGFFRRRFWRIIPPYWAALAISASLIAIGLTTTPTGGPLRPRDVLVHTFVVQDVVQNNPPNGVFWSIAVEWHIYFLFPLLLLGLRRIGAVPTTILTIVTVCGAHLLGPSIPFFALFDRFTPQFLILFVFGILAVSMTRNRFAVKHAGWSGAAIVSSFVAACAIWGSRAIVDSYFWVDIVVGFATATLFVAMSAGRWRLIRKALSARPLVFVGQFAFSLYLIHAPVLDIVRLHIIDNAGWSGGWAYIALMLIGVPLAFVLSYGFFLLFERPFLRIRSFGQLRVSLASAGRFISRRPHLDTSVRPERGR